MKKTRKLLMMVFAIIISLGMSLGMTTSIFAGYQNKVAYINSYVREIMSATSSGDDVYIVNQSGARICFTVFAGTRKIGSGVLDGYNTSDTFGRASEGERIYVYAGSLDGYSGNAKLYISY